jgi:hypothetical protein
MVRAPTTKELGAILVGHGIVDFVSGGKLSLVERNAIWKVLKTLTTRVAPVAARATGSTALRAAGTVARVGGMIAMRHPYVAAGAVIYVAAKNRDEISDLLRDGYDIVSDELAQHPMGFKTPSMVPPMFMPAALLRKKSPTTFNKAVKKGMSIVKGSTSYGKKGTINNAKKAFSAVTKAASAASKKKKAPKSGITRKIFLGVKGLFK